MPGTVYINPAVMADKRDAMAVAVNEALRVAMEDLRFSPAAALTPEQKRMLAGTAYEGDEDASRKTVAARIATFDSSVAPTPEQKEETLGFLNLLAEALGPSHRDAALVAAIVSALGASEAPGGEPPAGPVPEAAAEGRPAGTARDAAGAGDVDWHSLPAVLGRLDPATWGGAAADGRPSIRADTRTYRELHPLKELRSTIPTPLEAANEAVGNEIPSDNLAVNLVNQFIAGAGKFGRARAVSPGGTPAIMRETVTAKQLADPAAYFRVVAGEAAYRDIVNSGVVRAKRPTPPPGSPLKELIAARPTAFPSFAKGRPAVEYARGADGHYVIVTKDTSIKPSHAGRHSPGTTHFPTGPNGQHLEALPSAAVDVFKHVGEGDYAKVMSRGVPLYKPGDK